MINKYKVVISNRNLYREVELPTENRVYRIGTTIDCDFRLNKDLFFDEIKLDFINNDGNWTVMCSDNIYITVGDTRRLLTVALKHGDNLTIKYQESNNEVFSMEFKANFDSKNINFERRIDISGSNRILIGADNQNDIILHSKYIVHDKIELVKQNENLILEIKILHMMCVIMEIKLFIKKLLKMVIFFPFQILCFITKIMLCGQKFQIIIRFGI